MSGTFHHYETIGIYHAPCQTLFLSLYCIRFVSNFRNSSGSDSVTVLSMFSARVFFPKTLALSEVLVRFQRDSDPGFWNLALLGTLLIPLFFVIFALYRLWALRSSSSSVLISTSIFLVSLILKVLNGIARHFPSRTCVRHHSTGTTGTADLWRYQSWCLPSLL